MPIIIHNPLSSINLCIGNLEYDENRIRILVDTGSAMYTGSLEYHLWIMSQCPEMMEEYLQCGKDTMTVVIQYKIPYIVQYCGLCISSFTLGHDVSLNSVLIVPILGEISCMELNRKFLLTLNPPGKGLLDGGTLNKRFPFIPPSASTNIISTTSLLQYTSLDGNHIHC